MSVDPTLLESAMTRSERPFSRSEARGERVGRVLVEELVSVLELGADRSRRALELGDLRVDEPGLELGKHGEIDDCERTRDCKKEHEPELEAEPPEAHRPTFGL
jgi:hypothetical protein